MPLAAVDSDADAAAVVAGTTFTIARYGVSSTHSTAAYDMFAISAFIDRYDVVCSVVLMLIVIGLLQYVLNGFNRWEVRCVVERSIHVFVLL